MLLHMTSLLAMNRLPLSHESYLTIAVAVARELQARHAADCTR